MATTRRRTRRSTTSNRTTCTKKSEINRIHVQNPTLSIGEIISIFKWYIIRQSRTNIRIKLYIRVYICTLKNLGLGIFLFKKTTSGHLARDFASSNFARSRGVAFGALAKAPARVRSRSVARRIVGQLAREFGRARGSGVGRARGERRREAKCARALFERERERERTRTGARVWERFVLEGVFF